MAKNYISDIKIAERFGISRISVWRWVRDGNFPKPVHLSKGCTRWKIADIEKWEAEKQTAA